jgi:beta-lactamase superfamily II metal-dependent hydrolase
MDIHFIDVGCGNMTLMPLPDGKVVCLDCNLTDDNQARVLDYVDIVLGSDTTIDIFINSHRDADHMRGIGLLHESHPIAAIWDTGVVGTSPDSPEYEEYMDLRRTLPTKTIEARKYWTYGGAKLRCMNAAWDDYTDPNEQSVVLKVEYGNSSVMLAGDTSFRPWKEKIIPNYSTEDLESSILLAAHHGSITFFDDPGDEQHYFTSHIKKITPSMTLVSVGPNQHGLPDSKAIELYEKHSSGSSAGNKLYTTEHKGTMKLILKETGGWSLTVNQ